MGECNWLASRTRQKNRTPWVGTAPNRTRVYNSDLQHRRCHRGVAATALMLRAPCATESLDYRLAPIYIYIYIGIGRRREAAARHIGRLFIVVFKHACVGKRQHNPCQSLTRVFGKRVLAESVLAHGQSHDRSIDMAGDRKVAATPTCALFSAIASTFCVMKGPDIDHSIVRRPRSTCSKSYHQ